MGSVKTGKSELGAQAHTRYHSPRSDLLHNRTHVAMTGCSNVLPLLSCAILLSCLGFSAAAGAAFTAEVDGVNVTVDNEVCEVAAWRSSSLYATVTPAADIKFESRYGAPYYQQHLKPKVVPNLILLVVFILLFLFFIFWRWIYCCCRCCCNLCKPKEDPMKYIRDRGMKATKIFATLMALGVVASAIFGMTQAGKDLVDKTLYTVGLYTGFADDVFEGAYNITTDAQKGLGIFDDLSVILNVDVNVTGMNTDVQCLSPWLDNMKDPTDISSDLSDLDTFLSSKFDPASTGAASGLANYSAAGTSPGDWYKLRPENMQYIAGRVATPSVRSASAFFTNYRDTANAYVSARNALPLPTTPPAPPPTVSPSQRDAIRTTLLDLFDVGLSATTGFDLGARLTGVSNILQALTDLSALHNDSLASGLLQTLLDNLTALKNWATQLSGTDLPPLITDLSGQYSGYTGVQPCFDSLLYQMQHINETVIALPPAMQVSYDLLSALNSGMKAVVTGPSTNPQTLASALTAFAATLPVQASTNTLINELPKYISYLSPSIANLGALITDVAAVRTDTQAGAVPDAFALTKAAYIAYVQYAATPSALSYADFWNAQDAAANSLGTLITDVTKLTTTSDSTALSAASAVAGQVITEQGITPLPGDPTVTPSQLALVTAMTASRDAILPLPPYIAAELAEGLAYRALPSPKGSVLTAVTNTVSDLNTRFDQSISTVRADVTDYNAVILSKILSLHNSTVDQVNRRVEQYLPRVRKYDHMRMTGEYVYFAVVMFLALMTILIVWVNFQWGASFFTFLVIIAMLIYCIIGTVLLLLAVVGHDECGNAETQIFALIDRFNVDTGSFNATVLAGYYLKAEGGSFNAIVQSATGVNFAGMQSTINQTIGSAVTGITGTYTLRYKMLDQVNAMYGLQQLLVADVQAVQGLVQFENVHPLYLSTKELACCDVVDTVGNLWLAMFMAGWFAAALMVAMMCYIRRLDELPKKRCCGCAFRSYKEFLEPEDKKLLAIKNKGKYMPAGSEGSIPGTPGTSSINAKTKTNSSLSGGLITGVSGMSTTSFNSTQPIKAGVDKFTSDQTPMGSMTPRSPSYVAPESARAERSSESQNRASLLGPQLAAVNVEASGGSLLSSGASKKGAPRKSYTSKTEYKKDAMKKAMRMNQLG